MEKGKIAAIEIIILFLLKKIGIINIIHKRLCKRESSTESINLRCSSPTSYNFVYEILLSSISSSMFLHSREILAAFPYDADFTTTAIHSLPFKRTISFSSLPDISISDRAESVVYPSPIFTGKFLISSIL